VGAKLARRLVEDMATPPDEELTAVVRLTPRLIVQLWKSAPLIAHWMSRRDEGEATGGGNSVSLEERRLHE
jgi:hypothetical protein